MAEEKLGVSEEMTIKKETVNEKGDVVKKVFFFPDEGESIEAESQEEALKELKRRKKDTK